jgi:hypothetical protein
MDTERLTGPATVAPSGNGELVNVSVVVSGAHGRSGSTVDDDGRTAESREPLSRYSFV